MKYILALIASTSAYALFTFAIYGADAPPDNGASDFRTLKCAMTQSRYEAMEVKVLNTLAKYQFNTDTPTEAQKLSVKAQFSFTGFVATANTNIAVYVYDYSLPKARPGEPQSMSYADLAVLKAKVDNDPQIALDVIRNSTSEAWYVANGISHKVQTIEP